MSNLTIARRYALALIAEARRKSELQQVDKNVSMVAESLAGSKELVQLCASPVVSRDKKLAIFQRLFAEKTTALFMRFIGLMVDKKREALIADALAVYQTVRDEEEGIVEASARTAVAPTEADKKNIEDRIRQLTGKEVRLTVSEDASLIGGAVIRIADTVYDGSVRHQLQILRKKLNVGTQLN